MRAAERGVGPERLEWLGREHNKPEWQYAARVQAEYLDILDLRAATAADAEVRLDSSTVVQQAAEMLDPWPSGEPPCWDLIVVDDYQEATVAASQLLGALQRTGGARLVLIGNPDQSVQGYRGATPELVGRAIGPAGSVGAFGATHLPLATAWGQTPRLREVTEAVVERIPMVGGPVSHRKAKPSLIGADAAEGSGGVSAKGPNSMDVGGPSGADVAILAGPSQEAAHIARILREEHLLHGTQWNQMAVIARGGAHLALLRRELVAASVPAAITGSDVPLRDEPAVAPLLVALRLCVRAQLMTPTLAHSLLSSPMCGLDSVGMRRLRRCLRAVELAAGGGRSSDALLIEVLADQAALDAIPPPARRAPEALTRILAAGSSAAQAAGANAQTVLWAIWEATGLAERWRTAALAGGVSGARADHDLDVVLSLFKAAERYTERLPGASIEAFVDYLARQDLPEDSLAALGQAESVAMLTPAGAAGQGWDVVVVAGVQDGVWPDLRIRDSLLGSQSLVELLAGRTETAVASGPEARRQVLADELRAFAVACSRARRRLLVTACDNVEETPSPLCDLIAPPGVDEDAPDPRRVTPDAPLDLRGVVAAARAEAIRAEVDGDDVAPAATLLADLAEAGLAEADPHAWYGTSEVSSADPLWGEEETVGVSPSKIESVLQCPLRWALDAAGGTKGGSGAMSLGTLIHAIAEKYPNGSQEELAAELDRLWPTLDLDEGWPTEQTRAKADKMIERLAAYLAASDPPVAVEATFEMQVGRALVTGKIDRVEKVRPPGIDPDEGGGDDQATQGRAPAEHAVRVVDLKTGKRPITAPEVLENPQLGTYQLAVEGGALRDAEGRPLLIEGERCAEATLVYLGKGSKGPEIRTQPRLTADESGASWASQTIADAADTMAATTFEARDNNLCRVCALTRSCPIKPQGRRVIQ
jgi:superfamily I DNA/RNA helicase/RecB family exonuclease